MDRGKPFRNVIRHSDLKLHLQAVDPEIQKEVDEGLPLEGIGCAGICH